MKNLSQINDNKSILTKEYVEKNFLGKGDNAVSATKLATVRSINGIEFDGTGDIQIPLRYARAYTSTNPSSAPWFKVASWTSSAIAYSSSEISFYVIESRGSSSTEIGGILRAKIRQADTPGVTESVSLTWLYATGGINPDNYVATYTNNTDAGTVTLDLWVKLNSTYHSSELYVLGIYKDVYPSSYEWTLYSATSGEANYIGDSNIVSTLASFRNHNSSNIGETAIILYDHIDEPPDYSDLITNVNWDTNFSKIYFQIKTERYNFADYVSNEGRYRGVGNAILNNLNGEFTADIIEVFEINNEKESVYSSFTFKYDIENKTISLPQESNTILAYTKIEITPIIYN